jgi:inorganic pyrophosphatase
MPDLWDALEELVATSQLVIDRPKGATHPRYPEMRYPLDYGYLSDTTAMDGGGIDVWLGSLAERHVTGIVCTVDTLKRDSEIKVLVGCTLDEMRLIEQQHNGDYQRGLLVVRREASPDRPSAWQRLGRWLGLVGRLLAALCLALWPLLASGCGTPRSAKICIAPESEKIRLEGSHLLANWLSPLQLGVEDIAQGRHMLVTYDVEEERLVRPVYGPLARKEPDLAHDLALHTQIWALIVIIFPPQQLAQLSRIVLFTDGYGGMGAFYSPDPRDFARGILSVDLLDADDAMRLASVLVHELGHAVTLTADQQPLPAAARWLPYPLWMRLWNDALRRNMDTWACRQPSSYLCAFMERFWHERYPEWKTIMAVPDQRQRMRLWAQWYYEHRREFVSLYASFDPVEDMAESFRRFVLLPKPTGDTLADHKVRFYYDYPEMIEVRRQIAVRALTNLHARP